MDRKDSPPNRTATKKERFLKELRNRGSVFHAAHTARVGRRTVYDWRKQDEEFAKAWDDAREDNLDTIEQSLYERAVVGTLKPVYQQGELVGHIREFSDTAAIFMLKGGRPEKYRERYEHSGPAGGPISLQGLTITVVNSTDAGSNKTQ